MAFYPPLKMPKILLWSDVKFPINQNVHVSSKGVGKEKVYDGKT